MNVVDSSGWLEFFADGPNADFFSHAIQDTKKLIVPSLSIFEVFKRIIQQRKEGEALQAIAVMQQGAVVELTSRLALEAAKLSIDEKLPLADSVILATSKAFKAILWTQDSDFENISGVKYAKKA